MTDFNTVMYQQWSDLLFVHWPLDAQLVQRLIPRPLEVEQFAGSAWLGFVPFTMRNVRPRYLPAVPGLSGFAETNIRTYVRCNGDRPGVWFFSLDAANAVAVLIARTLFKLPYYRAKMQIHRQDGGALYAGSRIAADLSYEVAATWSGDRFNARPGTLEHFLAERYLLYTEHHGHIFAGRVCHCPYPLYRATVHDCRQTLSDAVGLHMEGNPTSVLYSPGVDVRISPLQYLADAVR